MRPEIDTLTLNRGQPEVTLLVCPLSYATLPSGVSSDLSKCFLRGVPRAHRYHATVLVIGVGRANAPPPSEPDWQFSSVRLSS